MLSSRFGPYLLNPQIAGRGPAPSLFSGFCMSQQKSAYFLITVSFVMGMIATTSISGCDSGKKSESTPAATSTTEAPAAGETANETPAGEAPATTEAPASAPAVIED